MMCMPTPRIRVSDDRPVSVLLLTDDPAGLPPVPPGDWWTLVAAVPAGSGAVPPGYAVEVLNVEGPATLRERARSVSASVRTARSERASLQWVWTLSHSAGRLRELAEQHDVFVAVDPATSRLLHHLPGVVGPETAYIRAESWDDLRALWEELARVAERCADPDGTCRPLGDLAGRSSTWRLDDLPEALRLPQAVASIVREHRERCGLLEGSEVSYALDGLSYPGDPEGLEGRRARWLSAALTLGHLRPEDSAAADVDRVSAGALRAADRALAAGDGREALARLTDAMVLMFHRSRHAETVDSPLVEHPGRFLAPLRASATLADLLRRRRDRSARPPVPQDRPPRVLVTGGAYGDFHGPVAQAMQGYAEVRVRDLGRGHLRRTVLTPATLPRLAQLLATRDGSTRLGLKPEDALDVRAKELLGHLRWADVVISDWADPASVWLSHLCPRRVRLVLRVHGVDVLEPWIHLVRWNRVDRVVVVSEPMRSLVEDTLAGMGVRHRVEVLPNLVADKSAFDRPKRAVARTTLGLVGWGREVKDPLWALRLLQRDPSWRLVLVGAGFPDPPAPHQAEYVQKVHELLGSPGLAGRVTIWGPTEDVGEALRHVGVILSTSRRESWHMGLVEGALSGAVPVVRNWPLVAARGGPRAIFPDDWVVDDLDAAEERVRWVTDVARWEGEGMAARATALNLFHPGRTAQAYRDMVSDLMRPSD